MTYGDFVELRTRPAGVPRFAARVWTPERSAARSARGQSQRSEKFFDWRFSSANNYSEEPSDSGRCEHRHNAPDRHSRNADRNRCTADERSRSADYDEAH
jgi:hypothetical protein